jgi:hypothetical protein
MPRYLMNRRGDAAGVLSSATRLAAARFPEVAIEHRYRLRALDQPDSSEVWVCRAPSEAELRAWILATGVGIDAISLIDADVAP